MSKPNLAQYFQGIWANMRRAASDECHAMPIYRAFVFSGPAPLLQKPWPERPQTPDPILGEAVASGQFQFAGKTLHFDHVARAWEQPTPSKAFAKEMHSFAWLQDLIAFEDNEETTLLVKAHVDTWIEQYGRWNRFAWDKAITAERCLAWLGAAPLLFSGDAVASSKRLESLGRQLRHLKSVIHVCAPGETRLWIAFALSTAGTCLPGMKGLQKTGLALLQSELDIQVLGDGGHKSRNVETAMRLLLELDSLAALLEQHGAPIPPFLRRTMDRLQPFVQFATLPNGELAPFHGAGCGDALAMGRIFDVEPTPKKPFLVAPHSKYQRLQTRKSTLLLDCGGAPDVNFTTQAHSGHLSFVFATKAGPLITNCGWSNTLGDNWHGPSRSSAAHSTLVIDDASSARILTHGVRASILGPILFDRETPIAPRRLEDDNGAGITASTLEYVSRYGLQYTRRLHLDPSGENLLGEDILERPIDLDKTTDLQPIPFCIRFHLHPDVRASVARGQTNVLLILPGGEGWRFRMDGGTVSLEPSIYLAAGAPPRASSQIVITGAANPNGMGQEPSNKVRWSLRKIDNKS